MNSNDETTKSLEEIIKEYELKISENTSNGEEIVLEYAKMLFSFISKELDGIEFKKIISELKKLDDKYKNKEIGLRYAISLFGFTLKQKNKGDYEETLPLLKELDTKYCSQEIGLWYANTLYNYTFKDINEKEYKEILSSLKELDEKHDYQEIGLWYAESLFGFSLKQKNKGDYEETLSLLKELNKKYDYNEITYLYLKKLIVSNKKSEEIEKILEYNINNEDILNKFLEIALNEEDFELLLQMLKKFRKKIITKKYHFFKYLTTDEIQDEKKQIILKIFKEIQTIMKILSVKKEDFEKLEKIGHYTNIEVIPYVIIKKITDEYSPDDTKGRLLLSNANYMNDPSEGKILLEYLNTMDSSFSSLFYRNEFEVSSVYLSSFTTAIDNLPMWSQYGDNGKGCCIVFNKNYFDKPKEVHDITDNLKENESVRQDECVLYRICYIDDKNNKYKFQKEDEDIKKSLENIYGNFKIINDENVEKIVMVYLEQIRYLFKSSDYKYEKEYRILKNVPINSKKIIVKKDIKPIPKLYVNIESKFNQISEVILGPKVDFPDYISPYIKYCDEKIEIRKSKAIRKHHFIEYPSHYEHIDGRGMGFYSRIPDQEYNFSRRLILLALAYAYLGAIENISNRLSECICCQSDDIEKLRQLYIEATKFKAVFLFHQPVLMKNISLIETWKYLDKVFDINSASDELLEQLSSVHYILNLDDDKKRKNIEDLKIKRQEKWNMLFTMLGIFIGLIELFK